MILLILAMEQRSGRNCVRAEQCWWKHSCLNRIIIYVQSCKTFSTIDQCTLFYLHAYFLSLKGKHALHLMIYSFAQRKISGLEMRMKFATDYWNLKALVASVIMYIYDLLQILRFITPLKFRMLDWLLIFVDTLLLLLLTFQPLVAK